MAQKTCLIVAALVRRGEEVLLVHQQGADDAAPSWALPGGVVEPEEPLTGALLREVREETGLEVTDPGHLLYVVQHDPSAEGRQTLAFVFAVTAWRGETRVADPDNLILGARFLPLAEAMEALESLPWPTMREPSVAFCAARPGRARCGGTGGGRTAATNWWRGRVGWDGEKNSGRPTGRPVHVK
ncbi:MAG: hypothetical protein A2W37_03570 [Chloroflexi bacterium RBG_16_63_12]|nr:MAG: hypothetical protein A2W37_03570 [Chloroflexi bacterium RBG_16_63_12]